MYRRQISIFAVEKHLLAFQSGFKYSEPINKIFVREDLFEPGTTQHCLEILLDIVFERDRSAGESTGRDDEHDQKQVEQDTVEEPEA